VAGKIVSTIITLSITTMLMLLIISYFLYKSVHQNIDRINYATVEVICTKGEVNKELVSWLIEEAFRYGDYNIIFKVEKQLEGGYFDTSYYRYNRSSVDDLRKDSFSFDTVNLVIGDRIGIFLEDNNSSLFQRLISLPIAAWGRKEIDLAIKSYKTGIVAKNGL